ncbi:MAG: carboxypeptidase regulatory-like domain-containing protein, partial [Acidobacteriota bacterium]
VAGIAVATIITNQQIPPSPTPTGSITVNALHIITGTSIPGVSTSTTDTIIASSHSDIVCATVTPTAAEVTVSGRVLSSDGRGLRNAVVTLTGPTGVQYSATTSALGSFRIDNVPAGTTYVAQVRSKLFRFSSQLVSVEDNVTDLNFTAQE